MITKIIKYLRGYVKIQMIGYSPERFLNLCKNKGIEVWELESKENSYVMCIPVKDFRQLKPILKKTRTHITILERYGVPFFFHKYRKRKLFFGGMILCLFLVVMLSRFVWNIEIQGNYTITDEMILEYLKTEGVKHGMSKRNVKCDYITTGIRKEFNDIIWVSTSLKGCNIIIHVKENTDTFQEKGIEEAPCDLISSADGRIIKIVTRSGVPCVKEGDTVKKGDLLVAGIVEVKNDAGETIREDLKVADADILAEVIIPYDDICENVYYEKNYTGKQYKENYIKIFGYRIGLGVRKYKKSNYDIRTEEATVTVNDAFKLPISYGIYREREYEKKEKRYTDAEMKKILKANFNAYCNKLEQTNTVILEKNIEIIKTSSGMKAQGVLKVKQSITSVRKSKQSITSVRKLVDFHGENVVE